MLVNQIFEQLGEKKKTSRKRGEDILVCSVSLEGVLPKILIPTLTRLQSSTDFLIKMADSAGCCCLHVGEKATQGKIFDG